MPYALEPAPAGLPLFTVLFSTVTETPPVARTPVAEAPTPPFTRRESSVKLETEPSIRTPVVVCAAEPFAP